MVTKRFFEFRGKFAVGTTLLLAASALVSFAATAEIYRWVDAEGTVHFGDRPPSDRPVQQVEVLPPPAAAPVGDDAGMAPEDPSSPRDVTASDDEATAD